MKENGREEGGENGKPSSCSGKREFSNPPDVTQTLNPSNERPRNDKTECDSDEGDDDDILEESQDKRWSKRREKVKQRDIPGVDVAYLAMDNETGNEVVWNEVQFSERKNFKEQEEKLRLVFDNLTRLNHVNLIKFHKYWTDTKSEKPRIIFITEYMPSGTMFRFLQRARTSGTLLNIKAWKNWTSQILSALNYLHSCEPPIVHANLTCNTIFIQQNGLVKIGCVAPNFIYHHVKTFRENIKNFHYMAPEYDQLIEATTQADIYSFGICALEMATTGALQGCTSSSNGSAAGASLTPDSSTPNASASVHHICGGHVTQETIHKALELVEDAEQRAFIETCLNTDPKKRVSARELVHWLERIGPPSEPPHNDSLEDGLDESPGSLSNKIEIPDEPKPAPSFVGTIPPCPVSPESSLLTVLNSPECVVEKDFLTDSQSVIHTPPDNSMDPFEVSEIIPSANKQQVSFNHSGYQNIAPNPNVVSVNLLPQQQQHLQQNCMTSTLAIERDEGYHTAQSTIGCSILPPANAAIAGTHFGNSSSTISTGQFYNQLDGSNTNSNKQLQQPSHPQHTTETRQIVAMRAVIDDGGCLLRIRLQLDDMMNRQLTTQLDETDTAEKLVDELNQHGFISDTDSEKLIALLENVLQDHNQQKLSMCQK